MGLQHRAEWDGLRALAVVAVVGFHALTALPGGARGVDLFFVLSGFLITSLLVTERERSGTIDFGRFARRRLQRLYPALLLMLAVYVLAAPLFYRYGPPDFHMVVAGAAGLYLMDFIQADRDWNVPLLHTWSLAIEAQFYLIWPFVVLALGRLSRDQAALFLAAGWALVTLIRGGYFLATGDLQGAYFSPLLHCSGLLLGAALAYRPPALRLGLLGLALFVAMLPITNVKSAFGVGVSIPLAEVAAALLILDPPKVLARRPLPQLGLLSYGIYLWHFPIWKALGAPRGGWAFLWVLGGGIAAATLSYVTVEALARRGRAQVIDDVGGRAVVGR